MTKPSRLDWVDTGKGIAIFLVALYHSTNWLVGAGVPIEYFKTINDALSSMRMPLFFVLAGLFARKWVEGDWRPLINSKVMLFAWVFIIWEVIGTAAIMLGMSISNTPVDLPSTAKALLISPIFPRFELWFIWALALFFILARLTRRVDYRVQLALAAIFSVIWLSDLIVADNIGWNGAPKYYFFFIGGIYLRSHVIKLAQLENRLMLSFIVMIWAALSASLPIFHLREIFGLYFLNCVVGVVAGISIARALSSIKLLRSIGQQTLPIYLAHTPIIILISFLVSRVVLPQAVAIAPATPLLLAPVAIWLALQLHRVSTLFFLKYLYEPPRFILRLTEPWQRTS